MQTVTTEKALETYEMTIKNERPEDYPEWVTAVRNAVELGDTSQLATAPDFAIEVWKLKAKKKSISFSDDVNRAA